jgi:hypothetical protein
MENRKEPGSAPPGNARAQQAAGEKAKPDHPHGGPPGQDKPEPKEGQSDAGGDTGVGGNPSE